MFHCLLAALQKHLFMRQKPPLWLHIHRLSYTVRLSHMTNSQWDICKAAAEKLCTVEIMDPDVWARQRCFNFRNGLKKNKR